VEKRGRVEVERGGVRATPPAVAAEGVGTPAQLGIVLLCRRDRRHGKPGGLLHWGAARLGGKRGQWVKGTQAGSKAGRRLESLPHIGHDMEGTEKANHSAAEPQPNRCGGMKIFARGKESTD